MPENWRTRAEDAEAACDRNSDDIIELLEAIEEIVSAFGLTVDPQDQAAMERLMERRQRALDNGHAVAARIKRPAQVKDAE
jgi:tRNA A37 threonylcarbamoyladenosine synthetase subunit TsaC/SUA5/YrdC